MKKKIMNKETLSNNIISTIKNGIEKLDDYLGILYSNIFYEFPICYKVYFNEDEKLTYQSCVEPFEIKPEYCRIDPREIVKNALRISKANPNLIVFSYSSFEWFIICSDIRIGKFIMRIVLSDDKKFSIVYDEIFTSNDIEPIFDFVKDWFVPTKESADIEFDILGEENKSSLLLFYGQAGTGKTSFIKHLIGKFTDKEFIFIDSSILTNTSQEKLISYFLLNQDNVFVFEDCEKALMNREQEYNPIMSLLLNLTDGVFGDVLGIKIICTFNASISKVDKALLRKGRLSLKYEFKPLNVNKAKEIVKDCEDSITSDMTLADIYNLKEENDYSKKSSSKIGF